MGKEILRQATRAQSTDKTGGKRGKAMAPPAYGVKMFGKLPIQRKKKVEDDLKKKKPVQRKKKVEDDLKNKKPIQRKAKPSDSSLQIDAPDSPLEKEADTIAEQIVRRMSAPANEKPIPLTTSGISRSAAGSASGGLYAPAHVASALETSKGQGQPLPNPLRSEMEGVIGADLSGVRIHTNAKAAELSEAVNAQAFTYGEDVYFNQGKYQPGTVEGRRLLGHEVGHVGQKAFSINRILKFIDQKSGIVQRATNPAHAGGIMGERDAAFVAGQQGEVIIIGPSGPEGHQLTESGFDLITYDPLKDVLKLKDNKASGGTSTVKDASSLTTNLSQNLLDAIKRVESLENFPNKLKILNYLNKTLIAVSSEKKIPPNVKLIITNAGGYHSGISKVLQKQGVIFEDVTGMQIRQSRKSDVKMAKSIGVKPGRPTQEQQGLNESEKVGKLSSQKSVETSRSTSSKSLLGSVAPVIAVQLTETAASFVNDIALRKALDYIDKVTPIIEQIMSDSPDKGVLITLSFIETDSEQVDLFLRGAVTLRFMGGNYGTYNSISEALTRGKIDRLSYRSQGEIDVTYFIWQPSLNSDDQVSKTWGDRKR